MTSDLPTWASDLVIKQLLWHDYGITVEELGLEDIYNAVRLAKAQANRIAIRNKNG